MALIAVAALALAPRQAGGATTYVRTSGTSMEPGFSQGDLALVREADDYGVGDVVAYESPRLDSIVLHRIVAREGDRYVFQGDNNDFLDDERLTADHVLGRLWVHVPRGGIVFAWLGKPLHATILVGSVMMFTSAAFVGKKVNRRDRTKPRRRRRRPPETPASPATELVLAHPVPLARRRRRTASPALALAIAGVGAALAAGGGYALTQPVEVLVAQPVDYTSSGELQYTADVPAGPVYEGQTVETGEPVFLRLASEVAVRFEYRFSADADHDIAGRLGLAAEVSTNSGWRRTLPVVSPRPFEGDEASVEATLDLEELGSLLADVEAATGLSSGQYRVDVVPQLELEGRVGDAPVEDSFEPRFGFLLDSVQWRPASPSTDEPPGPLTVSEEGAGSRDVDVPNELFSVGPVGLTVEAARVAGLGGGAGLLLIGLAAALLAGWPGRRGGEPARIQARYGRLLLPVAAAGGNGHKAVVELDGMGPLVRLAEHHERLVLHHERDGRHTYLLDIDDTLYRYVAVAP